MEDKELIQKLDSYSQKELNDYREIIPDFKKLLNITEENFDTLPGKEQLQIVYAYVYLWKQML